MTEQYAQPSINVADTLFGLPAFTATEFDAVNPVGTVDTTGARFLNPSFQAGIDYVLPPAGDPNGDAGQIIFSRPGLYFVKIVVGPKAGAAGVGITWVEPGGSRPALTTDPATSIGSPPADFEGLRAYGLDEANTVVSTSGLLLINPLVSADFPLTAYFNITAAAAVSATPSFTDVNIFRVAPLGS